MLPSLSKNISISFTDLLSACIKVQSFKTSLEVIGKVINVPECALRTLLRLNGYDDKIGTSSICIDEEMLAIFTEAYVRKMRSYFINSIKHLNLLTPQEVDDLEQFYKTFKKTGENTTNQRDWSQIDINLISEIFIKNVKNNTPGQVNDDYYTHLLDTCIEIYKIEDSSLSTQINENAHFPKNIFIHISSLCNRITHSRFYLVKQKQLLIHNYSTLSFFFIRSICVFGRYYIFSSDDSDEMLFINHKALHHHIHKNDN